jgi:arylsulfatase A-like enzyme
VPDTNTPTDLAPLQAAFDHARDQLKAYVDQVEAAHRKQHPDPVGPDGRPKWNADQAALRTAAWTDEENARLAELRAAQHEAVMALHRARSGE